MTRVRAAGRTSEVRRDLSNILGDGAAFSLMVGAGESYLAAFVLAIGLGEVASGLVTTVPLLAGGALQLVTPYGIRRLRSRRRWAVACAVVQAASFLPLVVGAISGGLPAWVPFAAGTLYWAAGMAVSPAWNAWVEQLVPRSVRNRYFARRTSLVQLGMLVGLVGGGVVLDRAQAGGAPLLGFAGLFAAAAAFRLVSARFLARQSEPPLAADGGTDIPLAALRLARSGPAGPGSRLILYLLALTVSVAIASPFFSAFMLVELDLSYLEYTGLVGTAILTKVLVLPSMARAVGRFGRVGVLRAAWLGIAAIPGLWLVSGSLGYLVVLQIASGACWAAHEYVTFLMLFDTIRTERRVAILTAYNLGNAVATVAGSLAGGAFFAMAGGGFPGYVAIFGTSSALRVAALAMLARIHPEPGSPRPMILRPVAVRPAVGLVLRPILSTVRRSRPFRRRRPDPDPDPDSD